jgi:hypothetical protein
VADQARCFDTYYLAGRPAITARNRAARAAAIATTQMGFPLGYTSGCTSCICTKLASFAFSRKTQQKDEDCTSTKTKQLFGKESDLKIMTNS